MRYVLKTLGCKANAFDGHLIEAELQKRGWAPSEKSSGDEVKLCVVNTCTVTDEADRQSRKLASRLSRQYPHAKVVVTGCAAEVDPERLASSHGIHYVVGNRDKPRLVELVLNALGDPSTQGEVLGIAEGYNEMLSKHPMDREWPMPKGWETISSVGPVGLGNRTRAFLKIQEGCNSFCTFCVIPYARGPNRSISIHDIVQQVQGLVRDGVREIILTGTNIGDYGSDWAPSFSLAQLLRSIFSETSIERLRVSSLDPSEITPELLNLMKIEERFCPHFHVSLQSPHSRILRLMKRQYRWEEVKTCLESISEVARTRGRIFVGMDLIAGFPGETDEEFHWTLCALKSLPWSRLHVFPYSERSGTPATRLPASVPVAERHHRAQLLRELSLRRLTHTYQTALDALLLTQKPLSSVLLERGGGGYSADYLRVSAGNKNIPFQWVNKLVSIYPEKIQVDPAAGDVVLLGHIVGCEIDNTRLTL